jgi:hypothetical protein
MELTLPQIKMFLVKKKDALKDLLIEMEFVIIALE